METVKKWVKEVSSWAACGRGMEMAWPSGCTCGCGCGSDDGIAASPCFTRSCSGPLADLMQ